MKKRMICAVLALTLVLTMTALAAGCPCSVSYKLGAFGVSGDLTSEKVAVDAKPTSVPQVTPLTSRPFLGWSLTDPATLKPGEKAELVDPATVRVPGDTTFYAVYGAEEFKHTHYVIGYPNGTFGPADSITRGEVATIIARAVLPDFEEGKDYGNPGRFTDVAGHWAESAIAYCARFGCVVAADEDGAFKPNRAITREELALFIALVDGVEKMVDVPFSDIGDASDWGKDAIYTVYTKGWVNGYTDGTFRPKNNIRRDETVRIFNKYLGRSVDADGLSDMKEYVHTGVASNNTENGEDEYMTWPDVPKDQWAYYEIIEAANDHQAYYVDETGKSTLEHWTKCWIDEKWRYGDNINDGGPGIRE